MVTIWSIELEESDDYTVDDTPDLSEAIVEIRRNPRAYRYFTARTTRGVIDIRRPRRAKRRLRVRA